MRIDPKCFTSPDYIVQPTKILLNSDTNVERGDLTVDLGGIATTVGDITVASKAGIFKKKDDNGGYLTISCKSASITMIAGASHTETNWFAAGYIILGVTGYVTTAFTQ